MSKSVVRTALCIVLTTAAVGQYSGYSVEIATESPDYSAQTKNPSLDTLAYPKLLETLIDDHPAVSQANISEKKRYRKQSKENYNHQKKRRKIITTAQIIRSYGYDVQIHEVATADGYILTLHRVVVNLKLIVTDTSKAVLFHHGVFGNSGDWLLGGSDSLPFLLARQGYDVWLANARGTSYSRAHLNHSVNSEKFWDFSFNEIGVYDIPPVLYYVRSVIGTDSRLYFIGHSMGATAFLVTMCRQRYHKLVTMAILLAPLAFLQRTTGPLKRLSQLDTIVLQAEMGKREIPMKNLIFRLLYKEYCVLPRVVCDSPLLFITNAGETIRDTETLQMVMMRRRSEASTKTLLHFFQIIQTGEFKEFNENGDRWDYDMEDVKVPTVVFSSDYDILAPTWDVVTLVTRLPNIVLHRTVQSRNFGHMDFVWGIEAPKVLYPIIVALLDNQVF